MRALTEQIFRNSYEWYFDKTKISQPILVAINIFCSSEEAGTTARRTALTKQN
jgi:hypothetical protein